MKKLLIVCALSAISLGATLFFSDSAYSRFVGAVNRGGQKLGLGEKVIIPPEEKSYAKFSKAGGDELKKLSENEGRAYNKIDTFIPPKTVKKK